MLMLIMSPPTHLVLSRRMQVMEVASSIINAGLHCPNPTGEPVGRAAAGRAPSRVQVAVWCGVLCVLLPAVRVRASASSVCVRRSVVARAWRARGMGSGRTGEVTFRRAGPGVAWFMRAGGVARAFAGAIVPPFFLTYKRFFTSRCAAAQQLSGCGAPEPWRGERSVRDHPRGRAHARCSAAWPHGSARGLSSDSSCCS